MCTWGKVLAVPAFPVSPPHVEGENPPSISSVMELSTRKASAQVDGSRLRTWEAESQSRVKGPREDEVQNDHVPQKSPRASGKARAPSARAGKCLSSNDRNV